jgi:hypothetical protein
VRRSDRGRLEGITELARVREWFFATIGDFRPTVSSTRRLS